MAQIKSFIVSQELFNNILRFADSRDKYKVQVVTKQEYLNDKLYLGGGDSSTIFFCQEKGIDSFMVCPIRIISYAAHSNEFFANLPYHKNVSVDEYAWKKVHVVLSTKLSGPAAIAEDINGLDAWLEMRGVLKKNYDNQEFEEALHAHEIEEGRFKKQMHFTSLENNKIRRFDNCYYYDINCAHGSMLTQIFPKSTEDILKMFDERKLNGGRNKKIFNYFVGCLCIYGHRKSYNWIVGNISTILSNFLLNIGGRAVYINTDGLILQNPTNPVKGSNELGKFKLNKCTTYTYQHAGEGSRYWIVQIYYEDGTTEIKGNVPIQLRSHIDLAKGKVLSYKETLVQNHKEYSEIKEITL